MNKTIPAVILLLSVVLWGSWDYGDPQRTGLSNTGSQTVSQGSNSR